MGVNGTRQINCFSTDEPWLLAAENFLSSGDRTYIIQVLSAIKDNHISLSFVNPAGKVFSQCLLVKIEEEMLTIDRPFEWDGHNGEARIFFQHGGLWHYFPVSQVANSPYFLHVDFPADLFLLQRRRYKRVGVPVGSRAFMKKQEGKGMTTVSVRDISPAGMLVCALSDFEEFFVDSKLNDILVSLPQPDGGGDSRSVLPLISQGRVVRSFAERGTNRLCYGISFEHESNYVEESLCRIVAELERRC